MGDFLNPFGIFGGDGNNYQEPQSSQVAAKISQQLFNESTPIRAGVFKQLGDFMSGNSDIGSNPMWQPGRMAIEDQYNVAKENIMANMPAGGQMNEALVDADLWRSKSLTDLVGNISQDMFNKAYGLSSGVPQTSIAGLTGAGNTAVNAMNVQASRNASQNAMLGDLGMAAGMFFGNK